MIMRISANVVHVYTFFDYFRIASRLQLELKHEVQEFPNLVKIQAQILKPMDAVWSNPGKYMIDETIRVYSRLLAFISVH
jgi:hypothetical protein